MECNGVTVQCGPLNSFFFSTGNRLVVRGSGGAALSRPLNLAISGPMTTPYYNN